MKLYVTLLHVIALLALTGFTLGDGDGQVTSPRVCTITADEDVPMLTKISDLAIDCLVREGAAIEQLRETKTLEERKAFFKNICDKSQQIRECLAGVEQQSEVCQDQEDHAILKIYHDLLGTTLDSGCVQDGATIATTVSLFMNYLSDPLKIDPFLNCVSQGIGKNALLANIDIELSSRVFLIYRNAFTTEECFGNVTEGDMSLLNMASNMKAIIGDIARKMKCIHPQDGTLVRCTTIDITLPETPRLCPFKSRDEKRSPVSKLLAQRLEECFESGAYHLRHDEGYGKIENVNTSRMHLKHFCDGKRIIKHCWSDVIALSSVCLNETQHNIITIVEDSLQNTLDYGCIEDGRNLADLLYKVVSEMETTPDENFVKECAGIAKREHEDASEKLDAARVLIYHKRLNVFKGCLINKLRGDNRVVFSADTFLTLVQRNMKCIDPEHGTIVLCETVEPTPSTGVTICPFVGENKDEPPTGEIFVDLGFKCMKASKVDFHRVDSFTTLEEFQVFFNSFCHHRLPIQQCIDQLSSHSVVCQNQTSHQMWNIFKDFIETTLETGCQQDGAALATITHGFTSIDESVVESDQLEACLDTTIDQLKNTTGVSPSTKSMLAYRELESLKECFINVNYEIGSFKNVFVTFMNAILRSLKCIHADDGTTVLCETIVNN